MNPSLGAGLEGRSVLVTGGAGGIGAAIVRMLHEAGAAVTATDRSEEVLNAASLPDGVRTGAADLSDAAARAEVLNAAAASGALFGVVHCAAVLIRRADIADVTEEDWDRQHDVNLKAAFFLCRDAAELMRDAGTQGRIVTFSSQGWWTGGFGGSVVYNSAKGGVVTMTRGLARVYGPHGIRVNSIAPGQARTEMLLGAIDPKVLDSMTSQTPLGRIAEPEEVAPVAVFLLSDNSSFITGSTLNVSGGFLMY